MNYTELVNHNLIDPPHLQRQFEHDLPRKGESEVKRYALIALPFISLYKPVGTALSVVMGSSRIISHLASLLDAKTAKGRACEVGHIALASLSLSATLFSFRLGAFTTASVDITESLYGALVDPGEANRTELFLSACTQSFYIGVMWTGSLEILMVSLTLQAGVCFYQAYLEYQKEGRSEEAAAKIAFGCVRLYQAYTKIALMKRRNALLVFKKFRDLRERLAKARKAYHLKDHPLYDTAMRIAESHAVIQDHDGKKYELGSHFHGYGKGVVKSMNINMQVNSSDQTQVVFKLNHVHRDQLENLMKEIKGIRQSDFQSILQSSHTHIEGIEIKKLNGVTAPLNFLEAHQIKLKGLGTIWVGASDDYFNLYDTVVIQMEKGANLFEMHEVLAFLNLEEMLLSAALEDIERLKLGQLFRIFFPRQAYEFERKDDFFKLPLLKLKQKMRALAPDMERVTETYLSKMELYEVVPGKLRYRIQGLADELYRKGARGLKSAITGVYSENKAFERVASLIKMGMLSSDMRTHLGITTEGLSKSADMWSGGSDSVFLQMVTERDIAERRSCDDFNYVGFIDVAVSLEVLETGTYQFEDDDYGARRVDEDAWWLDGSYKERPSVFELTEQLQKRKIYGHEIMAKERVAPSMIDGFIVRDARMRDRLIEYLNKRGLVEDGLLFGKSVTRVIRAGTSVDQVFA